jgi:hypothetical protein
MPPKKLAAKATSDLVRNSNGSTFFPNKKVSPPKKKSTPQKQKSGGAQVPYMLYGLRLLPESSFEAFVYERDATNDGYTGGFGQVMNTDTKCKYLEEAGFCRLYPRRVDVATNEALKNSRNSYNRMVMVRYVHDHDPATSDSTREGLSVLKRFLMDPEFTRYPPVSIVTVDRTDDDNRMPLDHMFLDRDIITILEGEYDDLVLNDTFFEQYSEAARYVFSREPAPMIGVVRLGYPEGNPNNGHDN